MDTIFKKLKPEAQRILETAYDVHFGVLQVYEVGKKWIIRIKDRNVIKVSVDDTEAIETWKSAINELNDNQYLKPYLDTHKVSEKGYICAENRN